MTDALQKDMEIEAVIDRLSIPSGFAEGAFSMGDSALVLEPWQRFVIDYGGRFISVNKSRQIGFSLVCAIRGRTKCRLEPDNSYTAIFSSYNLEDAKEKIRYVNILDESLPEGDALRRKRGGDSKTYIEYENGNRIITMFRPRGKGAPKGGSVDVFIDESAFMLDDVEVFRGAMGTISRGGAVIEGSTPLLKSGRHFDIQTQAEGKFTNWVRLNIPWYMSTALCVDVIAARDAGAGAMTVEERVELFGTSIIKEIFEGMFVEDFMQEYECSYSIEATALISWDIILRQSPGGTNAVKRFDSVAGLRFCKGDLYVGMDIGRRRNLTEISVAELCEDGIMRERYSITLNNMEFDGQLEVICDICALPNVKVFVIDETGIGMMLAENAQKEYRNKVVKQQLSPKQKPIIANYFRMMLEKRLYEFYPDRETQRQFHSIRKRVSDHGNEIYDVARNEKHHADRFFSHALMLFGASDRVTAGKPFMSIISIPRRRHRLERPESILKVV